MIHAIKNIIITIVIIIILLALGKLVYDHLMPNNSDGIVKFQTGISYQIFQYQSNALLLSNEGFSIIDKKGVNKQKVLTKYSNPFVDISDKFILHADRDGREFVVHKNQSVAYSVSTTENIKLGKVNSKGYAIIATDEIGYNGKLTIYNDRGEEIYIWYCGEGYITDVDISANNKYIVIAKASSSGEFINSEIVLFSLVTEETIAEIAREDSVIANIRFNRDGSFVALSDRELIGFTSSGKLKYNVDYANESLDTYDISNENAMVLSFLSNKNNSTVNVYSKDGKRRGSYQAVGKLKNLSVAGEVIIANKMRTIHRLTPNGKLHSETTIPHDIRDIILMSNRRSVFILGSGMAYVVNF